MRRRPLVDVRFRTPYALPGALFEVEAVVVSSADTPVDAISLTLVGHEFASIDHNREYHELLRLTERHEPRVLTAGTHGFRSTFDVPQDAPASFIGATSEVLYWLELHISIPWWPDLRKQYAVPMGWGPTIPTPRTPETFFTNPNYPRPRPHLEVALESTSIEYRGTLRGAVSVTNGSNVQAIALQIASCETIPDIPVKVETARLEFAIARGRQAEGARIPFEAALPEHITPTYAGKTFGMYWWLHVVARVSTGTGVGLRIPIVVTPPSGRPALAPGPVAPVGKERRAEVWSAVAQEHALVCDAENERMTGSFEAASLEIALEQRTAGGLHAVARVSWASLGLDLHIDPRRWSDILRPNTVEFETADFDEDYVTTARNSEQLRSWLSPEMVESIGHFDEVNVDDRGAVLVKRMLVISTAPAALSLFVARAVHVARRFGTAHAHVPPAPEMAAHAPAWRAFAERFGGRLECGRMWIHEATLGMERFSIGTDWTGQPPSTLVRLAIDPPLTRPYQGDLSQLRAQVQHIHVGLDAVEARLPAPLADPAAVEPILLEMVRLSRGARGLLDNPFR
ncbi:hypothetical protein LVJ94_41295 [Pendulispora rubella]|uniref:Arrestin-like N-terminal domain-containing protein n=1 Tax=Pendulispora rubella TaxID=2741070 RepID=A0ABZ2L3V7_9BACT